MNMNKTFICLIFVFSLLFIAGCHKKENKLLELNLTNETNSTCESIVPQLKSECDQSLDVCNEDLCERCGNELTKAGGEPGTWACSIERLNNCVSSNSCGGDEEASPCDIYKGWEGEADPNSQWKWSNGCCYGYWVNQETGESAGSRPEGAPESQYVTGESTPWGIDTPDGLRSCTGGSDDTSSSSSSNSGSTDDQIVNSANQTLQCANGTAYGSCATTKPQYCNNGTLINNCSICGCLGSDQCQTNGGCLAICSDGTVYGNCSITLPKFCSNGTLVDSCGTCGCPPDQTCNTTICILSEDI